MKRMPYAEATIYKNTNLIKINVQGIYSLSCQGNLILVCTGFLNSCKFKFKIKLQQFYKQGGLIGY